MSLPPVEPDRPTASLEGLKAALRHTASAQVERLQPWTFDHPLVFSTARDRDLHRIQGLLRRAITHLALNWRSYDRQMPMSSSARRVLALCDGVPYRPGSYRTDFVITPDSELKLIEITCRFAFNGLFVSSATEQMAAAFAARHGVERVDRYSSFVEHLWRRIGGERICVLLGENSPRNDSKVFVPLLRDAGFRVEVIDANEVADRAGELTGAAVIGELNHDELFALSDPALEALVAAGPLNDLRTVLLAHDKRFFSLLGDPSFLADVFSPEEIEYLSRHVLPTHASHLAPEAWARAAADGRGWIVKPATLGMSRGIVAGDFVDPATWRATLEDARRHGFVLQRFVQQRRFRGSVGGAEVRDFVVGTLLYMDDHFFGLGICRSSSHPITNVTDDRKLFPLVTDDHEALDPAMVIE